MEDYNKIIESLGIRFLKANNIKILQTFTISNFQDSENVLILLRKGKMKFDKGGEEIPEGSALFIPANRELSIDYGHTSRRTPVIDAEEFAFRQAEFFHTQEKDPGTTPIAEITMVTFEAKVFDTVNFFTSLNIPPFSFENAKVNGIIFDIVKEKGAMAHGSERVIKLKTEHLVVEVVRHIIDNNLFVEQMATNSTYFKDPRLIKVFRYIKDNLGGELSNKMLAKVAGVSEDYVGQYFKMLTGINPQDYIEYQRMEYALELLRTTKMKIRDIGRTCGYKDTAYFCRRFKMMFGIPAGKMRKRETLMNV